MPETNSDKIGNKLVEFGKYKECEAEPQTEQSSEIRYILYCLYTIYTAFDEYWTHQTITIRMIAHHYNILPQLTVR